MMTATSTEAGHFYWHCAVAAMMIDGLPPNAATNAHSLRAIRMATLTAAGKNGVLYASDQALATKGVSRKWHGSGLVKEHVVPVSLIHERVVNELAAHKTADTTDPLASDIKSSGLPAQVVARFLENPRAWQVAKVVREWTVLAWITKKEHELLGGKGPGAEKGLHKDMPGNWDGQDRFARYKACGIRLVAT